MTRIVSTSELDAPTRRAIQQLDAQWTDRFYGNDYGLRNAVVNGGLDIWQRGPGPFTTNGAYSADQALLAFSGSTMTVTQQTFTPGNTIAGYEPRFYLRSVVSSVAGVGNYAILDRRIESVRTFAGQTVTLSFWAKANTAKSIAIEFYQNFGVGGAPSADVNGIGSTLIPLSTSWERKSVTVTIPSISGKTLGTTHDGFLRFFLWMDAGSSYAARAAGLPQQSGTFDFWGFQLEVGDRPTSFERRPYATELALCQRYFWRVDFAARPHICNAINLNTTSTFGNIAYPVPMRGQPGLTTGGAAADYGIYNSAQTSVACTAKPIAVNGGTTGCLLQADSTGALVAGQANSIHFRSSSGPYFDFSAEL